MPNQVKEVNASMLKKALYDEIISESRLIKVHLPLNSNMKHCRSVVFGSMKNEGTIYTSDPFCVSFKHDLSTKIFENAKHNIDFEIELHMQSADQSYHSENLLFKFNRNTTCIHSVTAEAITVFIHGSAKTNKDINIVRSTANHVFEKEDLYQARTLSKRLWVRFDATNRPSLSTNILCLSSSCFNHLSMQKWLVEEENIIKLANLLKKLNPREDAYQFGCQIKPLSASERAVLEDSFDSKKQTHESKDPSLKRERGSGSCAPLKRRKVASVVSESVDIFAERAEVERKEILFMDCDWLKQNHLDISEILQSQSNLVAKQKFDQSNQLSVQYFPRAAYKAALYQEMLEENAIIKIYLPPTLPMSHVRNCILGSDVQKKSIYAVQMFIVNLDLGFLKNYTTKLESVGIELHRKSIERYDKKNRILKFHNDQIHKREIDGRLHLFIQPHELMIEPRFSATHINKMDVQKAFENNNLDGLDDLSHRLWLCFNAKKLNISAKVLTLSHAFIVETKEQSKEEGEMRSQADLLKRWSHLYRRDTPFVNIDSIDEGL